MLTSWGAAIVVFQQTAASLAGFHTAPPTSCSSSLDAGCLNYRVSSHKRSAWSLARRDLVNPAASQGKLFSKSHSFTLISPFFFLWNSHWDHLTRCIVRHVECVGSNFYRCGIYCIAIIYPSIRLPSLMVRSALELRERLSSDRGCVIITSFHLFSG